MKDLNKVTTVNNDDLLLLDDGVASSNAITFKNFLKTVKYQTFEGEGLGEFKEIIKSTIATELAADEGFVKKIYANIIDKLIGNNSDKLSNLFSKIKSRLTDSISSATLSKYDDLLIMSSSTIQKTPVPKQLLGVPSDFEHNRSSAYGNTIYNDEYTGKAVTINLKDYSNVNLIFYKYNDDNPIYLDIDISVEHNKNDSKKYLYLKYGDETEGYPVYYQKGSPKISTRIPMYKGWYIQKRDSWFGKPVPVLVKL
ncbi:DUF685 domain-containing protein [Borreliella bavariensis]|uniref:DUF685 domain-containing protein n=1 Tax=Borreliella bavariensis TaxID=664662 RepID=UPI001C002734|nr:DUF685 domain-containing protein [Borreliella bavariensis]